MGVLLTCLGVSQASQFVVNTSSIIHTIDAEYVSANLDFSLIAAPVDEQRWRGFDVRSVTSDSLSSLISVHLLGDLF